MIRPYELLARFDSQGKVAGVSIKSIDTVNGKDYELDPVPLSGTSDPAFTAFAASFASATVAERDAIKTELETLNKAKAELDVSVAALTAERDGLAAKISQLAIDQQAAIDSLKIELANAQTEVASLQSDVAALTERMKRLLVELPFNPRIIDASYFYDRITKDEFAALSVSDDDTLRTIAKTILAYKTNDWPVVFESPEFQGLIGYLVGTSFLTEDRAAELTKDASRAEAYDAE